LEIAHQQYAGICYHTGIRRDNNSRVKQDAYSPDSDLCFEKIHEGTT
jgi:hypothetical protein